MRRAALGYLLGVACGFVLALAWDATDDPLWQWHA